MVVLLRPSPRTRLLAAIAVPILAFVALIAWSFSAAVGSSPDDDFHLPAIWCGVGERPGLCELPAGETAESTTQRMVPAPILSSTCYAFNSDASASCWRGDESGMALAGRANIDGLYPPIFYATMSVFATPDVAASVITIRIVNSAFIVGILSLVFFALPRRLRPALLISTIATSVPLGLFLYASTNPSSWAMLSAAMIWICTYGSLESSGRRRVLLVALAILGTILGAGARADAAIFAVFGIALGLLLGLRNVRRQWIAAAGAILNIGIAAAFYLSAGQGRAAIVGLDGSSPPLTTAQHVNNLLGVPGLWTGALGQWGLGWLDTILPPTVWVLTTAVFAGAIFVGVRDASRRRLLAISAAALAIWVVPFVMLGLSNAVIGTQVQPRYVLPLMIILLGVATVGMSREHVWRGHHIAAGGIALSLAALVALQFNFRRYTTGLDGNNLDPGASAEWWWQSTPSPLFFWVTGSLAFTLMLALLWWSALPRAPKNSFSGKETQSMASSSARTAESRSTPTSAPDAQTISLPRTTE